MPPPNDAFFLTLPVDCRLSVVYNDAFAALRREKHGAICRYNPKHFPPKSQKRSAHAHRRNLSAAIDENHSASFASNLFGFVCPHALRASPVLRRPFRLMPAIRLFCPETLQFQSSAGRLPAKKKATKFTPHQPNEVRTMNLLQNSPASALSLFFAAVMIALLAQSCTLQELVPVGSECPPAVEHEHAYVQIGDIQCYINVKHGPSLNRDEECADENDETCKFNAKECKRYQEDFLSLIDNTQNETIQTVGYIIQSDGKLLEYAETQYNAFSNACPEQYPSCAWETENGAISRFGCIQCAGNQTICGFQCVDINTNKDHCGKCFNQCKGSKGCKDKKCVENACNNNQFTKDGNCLDYDVNHCGLDAYGKEINCTVGGWETGLCNIETKSCEAKTCRQGYHLSKADKTCVEDTIDCCGESCKKCDAGALEMCNNGVCANKCGDDLNKCIGEDGAAGCFNFMNDQKHCGACNRSCENELAPGAANTVCQNGQCIATQCADGYHLTEGNVCEPDDVENCGSYGKNCAAEVYGWLAGECAGKKCILTSCKQDFNLDSQNNVCRQNSNDCCGKNCIKCDGGNVCAEGRCQSTCSASQTTCNPGTSSPYCANLDTDLNDCGACGRACSASSMTGSSAVACSGGHCRAAACRAGYFLSGGDCIANTADHCGSYSNPCPSVANGSSYCNDSVSPPRCDFACYSGFSKNGSRCDGVTNCNGTNCENIAGWASGSCQNGVCKISSCKNGYFLSGNSCIACNSGESYCNNACVNTKSNIYHCGSCGNACNKSDFPNASGVECANGACAATGCSGSNVFFYGGQCKTSTATQCGSISNDCTKLTGYQSGECAGNACKITSCKSGYILQNNACSQCASGTTPCNNKCVNTNTDTSNCGSCGKTCTVSQFTGASSVSCSSGTCKPMSCGPNYYLSGTSCVKNDVNNCGAAGKKCNVNNFSGAVTVDCINSTCTPKTCIAGFYVDDKQCVPEGCYAGVPFKCYRDGKLYCCPSSSNQCNESGPIACLTDDVF